MNRTANIQNGVYLVSDGNTLSLTHTPIQIELGECEPIAVLIAKRPPRETDIHAFDLFFNNPQNSYADERGILSAVTLFRNIADLTGCHFAVFGGSKDWLSPGAVSVRDIHYGRLCDPESSQWLTVGITFHGDPVKKFHHLNAKRSRFRMYLNVNPINGMTEVYYRLSSNPGETVYEYIPTPSERALLTNIAEIYSAEKYNCTLAELVSKETE